MISTKALVVGLVGAGCIAAAGVGGYLAVRSEAVASSAAASPRAEAPAVARLAEPEAPPPAARPLPTAAPAPAPADTPKDAPVASPQAAAVPPVRPPAEPEWSEDLPAPLADEDQPTWIAPDEEAEEIAPNSAPADDVAVAVVAPVAPPTPDFEELTVDADAVIGIRLDAPVSSESARVEDRVRARVSRDVTIDDRIAVPAGSTLEGTVTLVERGGRLKEQARIGIRFTTLVLAGTTRVPIQTEPIYRTGDAPVGRATSKIGAAAVVDAIFGAVVGGKKGAAIGSSAGAAGGTAAVMAGRRSEAVIPAGTPLTVRLTAPAVVLIEHDQ